MDETLTQAIKTARHLLLVDDEEGILQSLRRMLRRDGYVIHLATSAAEGLAVLAREPVGVIISDQRMPGMTGSEFLSKVKESYPDTIRIVLSGYTELNSITDAINKGAIYKFLTKPWDDELLRAHIVEAFARYEMKRDNARLAAFNKAMIDAIPDALLLVDAQTRRVITANVAAGNLLGCAEAELAGKAIAEIEPLPVDQCYWDEISAGSFRALHAVETEYQRPDGSLLPVRKTTASAADGQSNNVLVLVHDLRHERKIESSLERLNAEMASVFEATSEGLLVLDGGRNLVRMNRRLNEIWLLPPDLISATGGESILRWIASQATIPDQTEKEFLACFESPESGASGYFRRHNGETIRWYGNPQMLNDEVIGHVFGFAALVPVEVWSSGSADT
jgi:PAS domain S-box-containing protein